MDLVLVIRSLGLFYLRLPCYHNPKLRDVMSYTPLWVDIVSPLKLCMSFHSKSLTTSSKICQVDSFDGQHWWRSRKITSFVPKQSQAPVHTTPFKIFCFTIVITIQLLVHLRCKSLLKPYNALLPLFRSPWTYHGGKSISSAMLSG
jgi:hypothetical protein